MAPHSSTLAWKIPWMEEPGRLQSMESLGVRHDRATSLSLFTLMHGRRKWQPTPVFLPGESQGQGSLVGCRLWGWTGLKWLSSSIWKQPKYPLTDEWIKKMWYTYTMEYHSVIKKNKIMPFVATWMDPEIIILSEVSQEEKGQILYDIACKWNLKMVQMNLFTK